MAINIPIISDFDAKGVNRAIKEFQQLDGVGEKTGFALKKAFVPATIALGALTAGIGMATKAAMEDEAAQLELARQLRTTTQATDAQIKAVEQSISAFSKQTAMADDQLRPALANLVRATGSLELSQKAMSVTADLATAKNIDMETASVAVSKALAGQTAALI
jgi:endonuclease III